MSDKPSGFFSRWQQRRQQVAEEEQVEKVEQQEVLPSKTAEVEASPAIVDEDQQQLDIEALPDPDSIEIGGSFAAFMGKQVDPLTKKAALRALWKQPHFNELDGLVEYGLDYSNQPKLTAEASAELVKKVFRKFVEKDEQTSSEAQKSPALADSTPMVEADQVAQEVDESRQTSEKNLITTDACHAEQSEADGNS